MASTDGFELAEVDLDLRGEGTLMSSAQKGRSDLRLASLRRDRELVAAGPRRGVRHRRRRPDARRPTRGLLDELRLLLITDEDTEFLTRLTARSVTECLSGASSDTVGVVGQGRRVVLEDDVPAVEAVLAAVGDDVARLPRCAERRPRGRRPGCVRRWARPPQSMHVMTGSGSSTASSLHRPAPSSAKMPAMPENRQILIASLPSGRARRRRLRAARRPPCPSPATGEVLVRTLALTIGAGQRAGLQGSASYAGAPMTGVVMGGTGVGRVEASNVDGVAAGDLVAGPTGWQDYAVLPAATLAVVDADVRPGAAPRRVRHQRAHRLLRAARRRPAAGRARPSSSAAASGSVGHLVGQIAKDPRAAASSASPGRTPSASC